jgi:Lon protease-like protein
MFELPLFPLNTVLFPGMPLNLHIFEERYKEMMNLCIQNRQPFGVLLIKEGDEVQWFSQQQTVPHTVGCTAQITQVQPLPQGRMSIASIGKDRFRVFNLKHDRSYLVGDVELAPLEHEDPMALLKKSRGLRSRLLKYLQTLAEAGKIQLDPAQIPNDPIALSYLCAVLAEVPLEEKQQMLDTDNPLQLMDVLSGIYRREVAITQVMVKQVEDDERQVGPFSLS